MRRGVLQGHGKGVFMIRMTKVLAACVFLCAVANNLPAQSLYATLTGVVSDPTQALVGQATVKLRDERSGSMRETVTNREGYFTFVSVPVGTYELTVTAPGFETYRETSIALGGGERRNINVTLKLGSTSESVVVSDIVDMLVPVDSGEKSTTLNMKQLENFVQVGSNAAEYIKIMPGFGIKNGTSNAANFSGQTIGINANGNAGSQSPLNNAYSYNGLPGNTLDITARRGARFGPRLQLRYAGQSQRGHDRRVQGDHVELQRRKPEGSGGDQFGGQIGRPELSRLGFLLCQALLAEFQRLAFQLQRPAAPGEQVFLSGRHLQRAAGDPRHRHSTRAAPNSSSSPGTSISTRCSIPACCAPRFPRRA